MKNKKVLVKYTDKQFDSIRQNLLEHARLYYPDSYNDFSENTFGSFVLDATAYVGDMLSFYLDYQVNESFLETAIQYDNIRKKASQNGYSFFGRPAVYGLCTFYVKVPANSSGIGPNLSLIPIMKKGSEVSADNGSRFILIEDVNFADPKNDVVAATFSNTTGKPLTYAIRAYGQVRSTSLYRTEVEVGDFVKMRKIRVGSPGISSISRVVDTDGHEYYQVKNLSQDVVYVNTTNPNALSDGVPEILKSKVVKRRFVMTQDESGTYLQFGYGDSDSLTDPEYLDPSSAALKMTGRNYISDYSFDPSNLLNSNQLGVGPSNTTLSIFFYQNESDSINLSAGQINTVNNLVIDFPNNENVTASDRSSIRTSVEVSNESPIVGSTSLPTVEEIRQRSYATHAAQERAVTKIDYEAFCYLMPPQFGSVKRASVINDPSGTNRRVSLYVVSEDENGNLIGTNNTIKNNLKEWINQNKMLNDNFDIYSANIINLGFDYEIIVHPTRDRTEVLNEVQARLISEMSSKMYIGEPLYITEIFNVINKVEGVVDTVSVKPIIKVGDDYSPLFVPIESLKSKDGTRIDCPKNCIFEIKYFNRDIRGAAV